MAHSLHLYQIKDTYYFRCRIPADLKAWFAGKEDIKRTLKTKSLSHAKRLLKVWSYKTEQVFTTLRSGMLTSDQALKLVEEFKRNDLKLHVDAGVMAVSGSYAMVNGMGNTNSNGLTGQVDGGDLLSTVVERYIAEYKTTEKVGGPTIYELETKCRQFVRVVGDMDIRGVTRDIVLGYLQVLRRLPKNMNKIRKYDGKSIEAVLAMGSCNQMSDTTLNNYLVRINSFFTWAVRVGYIDRNPADGVKHGKTKLIRPDELRKVYSRNDLSRLVDAYAGMADKDKLRLANSPDRFWLPMIALLSGMRLNEICQLSVDDVKEDPETGIWYFRVDVSEGDVKMIKSAAARRNVPIHQALINLGLLEYWKRVVKSGAPRMWMNLKWTGRGYHKSFANWFLGNGTTVGFLRRHVTEDPKINFHSFRHSFIDNLKQKRVEEAILAEIAGHSNKSMTTGRYGKPFGLREKLAVVSMVDYGIQFDPLLEISSATLSRQG